MFGLLSKLRYFVGRTKATKANRKWSAIDRIGAGVPRYRSMR